MSRVVDVFVDAVSFIIAAVFAPFFIMINRKEKRKKEQQEEGLGED